MEVGWREFLLLAVVIAAVWLGLSLLQLRRLPKPRSAAAPITLIRSEEPVVADAPPVEPAPGPVFAEHLAWTRLEADVAQLRAEVAAMRIELSELREAPRVSPYYAEAADLVRRGYDARGVAAECGISVAEAELVLAMCGGKKSFEDEVNDDRNEHDTPSESAGR